MNFITVTTKHALHKAYKIRIAHIPHDGHSGNLPIHDDMEAGSPHPSSGTQLSLGAP
jgi:hypothetical protein